MSNCVLLDALRLEITSLEKLEIDLTLTGMNPEELSIWRGAGNGASPGGDSAPVTSSDRTGNESPLGNLVYRPTLNKKRSVRFLSVRKWRAGTKKEDLEKLKEAKKRCEPELLDAIARELAEVVLQLVRNPAGSFVTAPPSSKRSGKHFATEIAERLAAELGLEFFQAFRKRPRKRSSHPRHFAERGEVSLREGVPAMPCILADDVATSGTTIEQCAAALGKERFVLPIVWIYEEEVGEESL